MSNDLIDDFISKYPFFELTEHGKIKCTITGHDLLPDVKTLKQYMESKKFIKAKEVYFI